MEDGEVPVASPKKSAPESTLLRPRGSIPIFERSESSSESRCFQRSFFFMFNAWLITIPVSYVPKSYPDGTHEAS